MLYQTKACICGPWSFLAGKFRLPADLHVRLTRPKG